MARDKLIRQLAEKYKVDIKEVDKAVQSQFAFVAHKAADPDMPSIRLPYFGLFKANRTRIEHLNRLKKEKNEREKQDSRKD